MREERKRGGNEREIFVYFYMINALFHSRLSHSHTHSLVSHPTTRRRGEEEREEEKEEAKEMKKKHQPRCIDWKSSIGKMNERERE
jgi:hypothetical protein